MTELKALPEEKRAEEESRSSGTNKTNGSVWFRRFYKECMEISPHIKFRKLAYGFYRIYYKGAYLHECYKEMPNKGYDWDDTDMRLDSQKYYEEFEDRTELTRKLKNYVEGYYDAIETVRKRVYLMRNQKDFYKEARQSYKQMKVK